VIPTLISPLFDASAGRVLPILAEAAVKSTILIAAAAILSVVMRNRAAAARHLVWTGALIGAVMLPFLGAIAPQWRIAVLPAAVSDTPPQPNLPNAASLAKLRDDVAALDRGRTARGPRELTAVAEGAQGPASDPSRASASARAPATNSLLVAITAVWAAGALAIVFALIVGNLGVQTLTRAARPVRDRRLLVAAAAVECELGIARHVTLLCGRANQMPATWGILRPTLVLPDAAESWTAEQQRVVLLHELSHVRRFDSLTQLVAQICCAVYWFNPAVWHAARRMREERERACDEAVLVSGVDACGYADQLTRIAREFLSPRRAVLAALSMARRSQLEGRVLAILEAGQRRPLTRRGSATLVALFGACALSLAAMHPVRGSGRPVVLAAAAADDRQATPVVTDTVRMSFPMRAGQWLEVIGVWGSITAVPTTGRDVEIVAVKKSQDGGRAALDRVAIEKGENDAGVKVCARYPNAGGRTPCNVRGRDQYDNTDVIVSFVVRVPAGVKLAAHTIMGNVTATRMSDYVWGTSAAGNIVMSTAGVGEASTGAGNITASLGATTWTENVEFETGAGHIVVEVPAALRSNVEAQTDDGAIGNDFGFVPKTTRDKGRIFGHIGTPGGGMLWLHTNHGNVFLRKAKNGDPRDIGALDTLSEIGTPRGVSASDTNPNPNPDPGSDPNPNPNPNSDYSRSPSPSPSPSPSASPSASPSPSPSASPIADLPAAVDAPYKISSGGVTDERVAQYVAGGFLRRFTPRAASGMRDSAAIVKLASLALPRWVSYQAGQIDPDANLVGDRSIWALQLVHMDGRIFEGIIGNLKDRDWRVRAYAAWVLGVVGEGRATEALLEAASDYHWRVRMHAAFALGEYRAKSALPRLIGLLSDEHYQVRTAAVDALAAIGDKSAVPALRGAARDPHMMVREQALAALAALDNS
jgi:beta-lactamase regulating signal transducer with metallopeptidase domain